MMQAPRKKTLPTMTTARQALPTMTAKMRTTMMATTLAMKVLGLHLITVLGLITVGTRMTMTMTMTTTAAASDQVK
jgi:hypothetical protein